MTTIVSLIKDKIVRGTEIPKPRALVPSVVKGWGIRRGQPALIYKIANRREKGISAVEFEQAFDRLIKEGNFPRFWFNQAMADCAKEGPCNFTTIGGIFVLLGFAGYSRGIYTLSKY